MRELLLSLIAAGVLAGCANVEPNAAPMEEKEFVTGSNIPRKDRTGSGVAEYSREALEKFQAGGGGQRSTTDSPR